MVSCRRLVGTGLVNDDFHFGDTTFLHLQYLKGEIQIVYPLVQFREVALDFQQ